MSVWNTVKAKDTAVKPPPAPGEPLPRQSSNDNSSLLHVNSLQLPEGIASKYSIVRSLGSGAYGTALLMKEVATGDQYVAKIMNLTKMSEKERAHMRSEVQCLAQCDHPNIIRQKEVALSATSLALVMEYGDGGDLRKEILARKSKGMVFSVEEIAIVFAQIALSIDYVHRQGILHRDVKPANIFFTKQGLVKLGDFGFSKQYEDTLSNLVGDTVCGTPFYMSPEMWQDERYSKKSDLWSLGIVLYEMICLERPFQGDSLKAVSESVMAGVLRLPPTREGANSPSGAQELWLGCQMLLKVNVRDRAELLEVLALPVFQNALKNINSLLLHPTMESIRPKLTTSLSEFLIKSGT